MITNINQRAKELYEFNASNLGGGMFYNNFVVFNHGNNLYSVRNTNTGVISLTKADCAMNAIEKVNKTTALTDNIINGDIEQSEVSTDKARSDYGNISQNELYSRLENLENRGKAIGAECVIMPYNDGGHLSCFWYPQSMVAYIIYKGFAAEFFVKGDVEAYLYDSSGYIKRHIVRSAKSVGIREDETTCKLIQNDVVLSALEKTGTLEFVAHPWVELQIRNVKENKIVKNSILVNDNVLFDVENNFDDIIKTIDRYKRKKEKKNNDIAKYALEVANFEDDAVTLNTYSDNDDFFYKKYVVEKSWLVDYLVSQNTTLSALLYSPEFEKTFKIYNKAKKAQKIVSEVNLKITKELIRHGLSSGYIKLRYENARTVFFIHEGNYNFVSENAKGKKSEEFKKIMSLEEVVDEIFKVLESTRTSPHYEDKFAYMFDLEYCLTMFQSTLFVIGVLEEANCKYIISEGRIDVFSPDGKLKMYINILFDENNSSTRFEIDGAALARNEFLKWVKSLTE